MTTDLEQLRTRFVATGGQITQSIGIGRVIGQIFAYIYFSRDPQGLDDLTEALDISKGSASMCVRQLEQWGALRQVWIKGERKDYYEATEDFGRIIRRALLDLIGRRMETTDSLLEDSERLIKNAKREPKDPDRQFLERRVKKLRVFRSRAQYIWDSSILRLLMK
jgi:DNA-binding transcriptional regulator GbsR (MarR family)